MKSLVFAPYYRAGGVKSLYRVCEWASAHGRSSIVPFLKPELVDWFAHDCQLYDHSYLPDLVIYPEVFQPRVPSAFQICYALGKHAPIETHADLVVCRARSIQEWVKDEWPDLETQLILPSIDRSIFEYDGRVKEDVICYMTHPEKFPETADLLRAKYGERVVEIVGRSEVEVADILKSAKVFVWRSNDRDSSPRPPKEALVAGCNVVGLASDLQERHHLDFGIGCTSVEDLLDAAGDALSRRMPTDAERSVVRDTSEECSEWTKLLLDLKLPQRPFGGLAEFQYRKPIRQ
jgi:hypothetical protein